MGMYTSHLFVRCEISKEEYDFLLPIYGHTAIVNNKNKGYDWPFMHEERGRYYFIGKEADYEDMRNRCKYL